MKFWLTDIFKRNQKKSEKNTWIDPDCFIVKSEDVLDKGTVTLWSFKQEYPYLVYRAANSTVHVNTDFHLQSNQTFLCVRQYDRFLADSLEAYQNISKEDFEATVYGAWMDGAR